MQQLLSIHDIKAEAFFNPLFVPTVAIAIRSFSTAANEQGHDFNLFAGDYSLFHMGTFDEQTGKFEIFEVPINLGLALTFITHQAQAGAPLVDLGSSMDTLNQKHKKLREAGFTDEQIEDARKA